MYTVGGLFSGIGGIELGFEQAGFKIEWSNEVDKYCIETLKKNHKHIGNCSLTNIDWINRRAKYGRIIGVKNRNFKGLGSEAMELLKEYAFNKINLNSIWTGVNEKNIASIKSNIKSGMKKIGVFPEAVFYNGKLVNMIMFCITKKEFEKKNKKS